MQPAILIPSTLDEETARAEIYGLLAALFYSAPTPELLDNLRAAVTQAPAAGALLEASWGDVVAAARAMSAAEVAEEYDALFGGVGRPAVHLYGSHYMSGFLNEKSLAALRGDLATLGLDRVDDMSETEDHFAYVCEVMRYLIAGEDVEVANLTRQREFFTRHVQPWALPMCEAISAHPKALFCKSLANFTQTFIGVESQGFDMLT